MFLVKMNFVAFMTALYSLSSGNERTQDATLYYSLPENVSGSLYNVIFRRANIVGSAAEITVSDIAVNAERRRASFPAPYVIRKLGDLANLHGLEEYDASGFNVVQRLGSVKPGELAEFFFYRKDRNVDWAAADLEKQFPPDAIFSGGKWLKSDKAIVKK
jgi:hypothetical protein